MAFRNAMKTNKTTTENGALSYQSTRSPALDFFFKVVRNTPVTTTSSMFQNAYVDDKKTGLRLAFHLRDCRGGKGERDQFRQCLKWLAENDLNTLLINLKYVPVYGRWDDLLALTNTPAETVALSYYARALIHDKNIMDNDNKHAVSLAAKWAPTEGASLDRKTGAAYKLARLVWNLIHEDAIIETDSTKLPKNRLKAVMTFYRKVFLAPLRNRLNLVETKMSSNKWDDIEYSMVPSLCMFKHRKAFTKHSEAKFTQYLADVKSGKTTINAGQVFPHQMVAHYLKGNNIDETVELQWKALVADVKRKVQSNESSLGNSLAIVDVSGSMSGTPMEVAIALGLLLSEVVPEPFHNNVITFASDPKFHMVPEGSLYSRVNNLKYAHWDMTTNYHKVFELILNRCVKYNVPQKDMPKRLFVFSDMQFGSSTNGSLSEHRAMVNRFRNNGYNPPEVVFWNLRGDTLDFPETVNGSRYSDAGIAMVSGFSPALLQLFTEEGNLDPIGIMKKALFNPRYDQLKLTGSLTDASVYEMM